MEALEYIILCLILAAVLPFNFLEALLGFLLDREYKKICKKNEEAKKRK